MAEVVGELQELSAAGARDRLGVGGCSDKPRTVPRLAVESGQCLLVQPGRPGEVFQLPSLGSADGLIVQGLVEPFDVGLDGRGFGGVARGGGGEPAGQRADFPGLSARDKLVCRRPTQRPRRILGDCSPRTGLLRGSLREPSGRRAFCRIILLKPGIAWVSVTASCAANSFHW